MLKWKIHLMIIALITNGMEANDDDLFIDYLEDDDLCFIIIDKCHIAETTAIFTIFTHNFTFF